MMIKAVIFDFDGVILESNDIKSGAFAELFKDEPGGAIERIVRYHLENKGLSRYEKFRFIYKNFLKRDLSDAEFGRLCRDFSILVLERVKKAEFVKGAKEFLEGRKARYKYFLISATPQAEIDEIISARQLDCFFKRVYGAPLDKSVAVSEILIEEGLSPAEALYVGDALSDHLAAMGNGVNFVARIEEGDESFKGIDCPKIKDMTMLNTVIEKL